MKDHIRKQYLEAAERRHICDRCGAISKVRSQLIDHFRLSHSKRGSERTFCDLCRKKMWEVSLREHFPRVHPSSIGSTRIQPVYQCDDCTHPEESLRSFRNRQLFKRHLLNHLEPGRNAEGFATEVSDFSHLRGLQLQMGHQGSMCDICGENFKYKLSVVRHLRNSHCVFQ